jgi:hypothetical protein
MDARIALCALLGLIGNPLDADASTHPAMNDDVPWAYRAAAAQVGINPTLLWVIALQESGMLRGSRETPWPWTLNIAGRPARFATRESACRAVHRALEQTSPKRIDVGLAQVNWGYHHEGFQTPCDLLDPYRNLAAACRYLVQLHRNGESWLTTAARYHRPAGGAEASRYAVSLQCRLLKLARRRLRRDGRILELTVAERTP